MPVVDDALPPDFPLGVELEVFLGREVSERYKLRARRHDALRNGLNPVAYFRWRPISYHRKHAVLGRRLDRIRGICRIRQTALRPSGAESAPPYVRSVVNGATAPRQERGITEYARAVLRYR